MFSKKNNSRSRSLAARLTTWYSLASFVLIVSATGILYWGLVAFLNRSEDLFLTDKIHVLRAILRERPNDIAGLRWEAIGEVELESSARRYAQFYARLVDDRGVSIMTTKEMDGILPPSLFPAAYSPSAEPSRGVEIHAVRGRSFRVIAADAQVGASGGKNWIIQVAVDRANDTLLLANYKVWMAMVLLVASLVCPFAGYRIAQRGIDPIRKITETAQQTGSANLDARIDSAGYPVELAALADTLNAMLDRLADSFSRLNQFSADIAHELRTPINNIRGEAEVTLSRARSVDEYKEALTSCLEESVRLSDLISRLLFLARAENPTTILDRECIRLERELVAVRDYYVDAAAEAGVTLSIDGVEDISVVVDRRLVKQAIGNLVANSIAHTAPGGEIILAARVESGQICLEVRDTGCGIAADDLPKVWDRFHRSDRSRSSHTGNMGLGLAIVKSIVSLHGGQTEISSELGTGTSVLLRFPLHQSELSRAFPELNRVMSDDKNVIQTL